MSSRITRNASRTSISAVPLAAGLNFEKALRFAGYDCKCEYHPDEGHCSCRKNEEYAVFRLLYLWKDWESKPITVKRMSHRSEQILVPGDFWSPVRHTFPSHRVIRTEKGEYRADGKRITLITLTGEEILLTEEFEDISALALSSDLWRLYIGDRKRRCIYAATLAPDGTFDGIYVLASLHVPTNFCNPGVLDMCVDSGDRIYAATELGIQCVRSYGLVDVILLNPERFAAVRSLHLEEGGKLYALSSDTAYVRHLNDKSPASPRMVSAPKQNGYYEAE